MVFFFKCLGDLGFRGIKPPFGQGRILFGRLSRGVHVGKELKPEMSCCRCSSEGAPVGLESISSEGLQEKFLQVPREWARELFKLKWFIAHLVKRGRFVG